MNWEAIGAVGEILGAAAVVITLFYLSTQMRLNAASLDRANEYSQASSIHESNVLYTQVFAPLVTDADLSDIYNRALAGDPLDATETTRFTTFLATYMVWLEDLYHQQEFELGFARIGDTSALFETVGPYARRLLTTTPGRHWWQTDAPRHFSPDFYQIANQVLGDTVAPEGAPT